MTAWVSRFAVAAPKTAMMRIHPGIRGRVALSVAVIAGALWGCSRSDAPTAAPAAPPPAVSPEASPPSIPDERVEVTAGGFQPSRIDVGAQRRVVFRRTSDSTCATSVVFPTLGIQKPLPLNTDVVIDLPATARGELAFQCRMGMDRGKVVAR